MSGAREKAFEFGGVDYRLRFGMAAMVRYEQLTGENGVLAAQQLQTDLESSSSQSATKVARLFQAALKPAVEFEDALDMIDEIGVLEALGMLGEVLNSAFEGVEEAPAEKNPRKASAKTR